MSSESPSPSREQGGDSPARFEFRVWGDGLEQLSDRIRSEGEPTRTVESAEVYIVSTGPPELNPKSRDDMLDIKKLIDVRDGFEQWDVAFKQRFPISSSALKRDLLGPLGVEMSVTDRSEYSFEELVGEIVAPHADLAAVEVTKKRSIYDLAGCSAEVAAVSIGDRAVPTVAIESADFEALRRLRDRLGLETWDNVSYPRMIKRVVGAAFSDE